MQAQLAAERDKANKANKQLADAAAELQAIYVSIAQFQEQLAAERDKANKELADAAAKLQIKDQSVAQLQAQLTAAEKNAG